MFIIVVISNKIESNFSFLIFVLLLFLFCVVFVLLFGRWKCYLIINLYVYKIDLIVLFF